jgi:hypothetical protein
LFRLKAADALGQVLDAEAMALPAPSRTQFDHRTKGKKPATILLPNPVAAHDRGRDVMDGRAKKFRYTHREQAHVFGAVAGLECWRARVGHPTGRERACLLISGRALNSASATLAIART